MCTIIVVAKARLKMKMFKNDNKVSEVNTKSYQTFFSSISCKTFAHFHPRPLSNRFTIPSRPLPKRNNHHPYSSTMYLLFIVSLTSIIGMVSSNPTSFAVHFSRIVPHEIAVEYVGHSKSGLSICQGDCRTDDDCLGDLKCFHRENGDPCPPGCRGDCELYNNGRRDFCYDPLDSQIESMTVSIL